MVRMLRVVIVLAIGLVMVAPAAAQQEPEVEPPPLPDPVAPPAAQSSQPPVPMRPPMPEPIPEPAAGPGRTRVYGGLALMTYSERYQGIKFVADNQAGAIVGLETGWARRPGKAIAVAAQVAVTNDVYMKATQQGMIFQENRFHQEVIEGAVRWRTVRSRRLDGEWVRETWWDLGGRATVQRLHFTDIPGLGDANETVYAFGPEAGFTFQSHTASRARMLRFAGGLNYAFARNDAIDDDDFGAFGLGASIRGHLAWRTGGTWLALGAHIDFRRQNGSDVEDVTIMGMPGQAVWPKNDTWIAMINLSLLFGSD